jgi:hypothetical protein
MWPAPERKTIVTTASIAPHAPRRRHSTNVTADKQY